MRPLVSVIMSVYNGEKYLKDSIESILNQTYKNIEFIIVNDGSIDLSFKILESYRAMDKRILIINNKVNKGLIYSLNKALKVCKGKYIARMDADDISILTRIEEQVNYMEDKQDLALCGSAIKMFLDGKKFICKSIGIISTYDEIRARSLFECCFMHPTIMFNANVIRNKKFHYRECYKDAEDFGLWTDILADFRADNIDKNLIKYRIVKNSITRTANRDIKKRADVFRLIYKNYFKNLGYNPNKYNLDLHFEIAMIQNINKRTFSLEDKLIYLEQFSNDINIKGIRKECSYQYLKCCIYQGKYRDFIKSSFNEYIEVGRFEFCIKKIIAKFKIIIKDRYK